jgi:hypothetical protein
MLATADAPRALPAYEDALNCAGVTQAAVDGQEKGAETGKVFDSAIYWSLAAMEVARSKSLRADQAEQDQKTARARYRALLDEDDADAWSDLAGCVKATPPL